MSRPKRHVLRRAPSSPFTSSVAEGGGLSVPDLDEALALAVPAKMRSHLVVRLLGVSIEAASDSPAALRRAERMLADAPRVCEACALNYRVQAAIACAQNGDLVHARRHLGDAERITALWHCAPWSAAVWEARAHLRAAEGHPAQAVALLHEAALSYQTSLRPADERRCLDIAHSLG